MPQKAPDDIYASVLGMCEDLRISGYDAKRVTAYTVVVRTTTPVQVSLSTYWTHTNIDLVPERVRVLRVRVTGTVWPNKTTQETCDYADWRATFLRVWERTQIAHAAVAAAQVPSAAIEAARAAIEVMAVPMPEIRQRTPEDGYVYITYPHGIMRCLPKNAGTAAFALWNLRD